MVAILVVKRKEPHAWWGLNFHKDTVEGAASAASYFRKSVQPEISELRTVESIVHLDHPLVNHPLLRIKVFAELLNWVAEVEKDGIAYQFTGKGPVSLLLALEEGLPELLS